MKKHLLVASLLLMAGSIAASWTPSEKYANWVSHFQLDKTWKFENSSHNEGTAGSVHSGTSTVDFPGTIAWAFMSWDERTSDSDDHDMRWFELYLRNGNNDNDKLQIAGIYISGGDNDYWPTKINNYNGNVTYYGQGRWYDYADGAWFLYMVTEYSDKTRQLIERAGDNLQIVIRTEWDDNHWNTYSKSSTVDYSHRQFMAMPAKPSITDVSWLVKEDKTAIKYTRSSVPAGCYFRLDEKVNGATFRVNGDQSTASSATEYTYPFTQSKRPAVQDLYKAPIVYVGYDEKKYTMNQTGYKKDFGTPQAERIITSEAVEFAVPQFAQIEDLTVKDRNDGTIGISWTMQPCTGSLRDESNIIVERATDMNFTQNIKRVEEDYTNTRTSYDKAFAFDERDQKELTYYIRVYRKNASPKDRDMAPVKEVKVNSNYATLTSLTGELDEHNRPVLHWDIMSGVCTEDMELKLRYSDYEQSWPLVKAMQMKAYTVEDNVPTCKPIEFEGQIVEHSTNRGAAQHTSLMIPSSIGGKISSYSVSKGFYNDRVELRWTIDKEQYNFTYFQVGRRELGSQGQAVTIGTIDAKVGVYDYAFEDVNCVPGVYYQYFITGYSVCNDLVDVVHSVSTIGFAQPYGVVSGQITYSGNQGVADVAVCVMGEDVRRNRSLRFIAKNNAQLEIPDSLWKQMVGEEGTVEFYAYAYTDLTFLPVAVPLEEGEFNHIAITYDSDSMFTYVNGQEKDKRAISSRPFDKGFVLGGAGFEGFIDEIRIWNIRRSQTEIARTMCTYLTGQENHLTAYYRCDDEVESELFDISRTGTTFNEHHLPMRGIVPDPDNIPTPEQLSLKAYTDKDGNYLINNIPYTVGGSLYKVIPTLGVHEFSPTSRPLFFSTDAATHNAIDFTDKSSFEVTGKVTYENTDYPVAKCQFYVDGQVCSSEGMPVESDEEGNFRIQVPIGEHHITVKKDGHTFVNEGRYPADPSNVGQNAMFDAPRTNMRFYDNTTCLVVGRVAGGSDEEEKAHGCGIGKATIGQAQIVICPPEDTYNLNLSTETQRTFLCPDTLTCNSVTTTGIASGNLAHSVTILTDPVTGEFAVALPPIDFEIKKVSIPSNPAIQFDLGKYANLTLGSSNIHQTATDTLYLDSVNYKTVTYLQKLDIIHYALPELTISQWGNRDGAFGEKMHYITLPSGQIDTISLYSVQNGALEYTMGVPCFIQDKAYKWTIQAFETYVNYDNAQNLDTVFQPMRNAIVTVENELGDKEVDEEDGHIISLNQNQILLDSLGLGEYLFVVGEPNIVGPYTYNINITYETPDHSRVYAWDQNGKAKGLIFGARTSGTNFITDGPDQLLFVLRDPPGGQSFATWEKGQSVSTTIESSHEQNRGTEFEHLFHGGLEEVIGAGVGVITFTEISEQNNAGFGDTYDGLSRWVNSHSYDVTTTQTISTKAEYPYIGTTGDVFVGAGTNVLFGNARKVTLERVQDNPPTYKVVVRDVISTGSVFKTTFNYSTREIEEDVIPNYTKQRNALLQHVDKAVYNSNYPNLTNDAIYITTLSPDDKRFGSDNHDERIWGPEATPVDSFGGPSYIMIPPAILPDTAKGIADKVCHFNNQIHRWQEVLAQNEQFKVRVHHSSQKFDQNQWDEADKKAQLARKWRERLRDPNEVACRDYGDRSVCDRSYLEEDYADSGVDTALVEPRDYYSGGWLLDNYSLGGGVTLTSAKAQTNGTGDAFHEEDGFKVMFKGETGLQIQKVGFTIKNTTYAGYNHTYDENNTTIKTSSVAYTLAPNEYEYMSIDVYAAPDGFGPIFATRGGQTYCPYEGEERTKYFEPGEHELHTATVKMEEPEIRVARPTITDVPIGGKAIYTLTLTNLADINPDYFTWLKLYAAGDFNKYGAQITIDGAPLTDAGRLIKFYPSTPITKTLVLTQADWGVLDYDSIAIVLSSDCALYQDADTVWLSAHFVPTCSAIQLKIDNTTVNTTTGDTLPMTVNGYDRNFRSFNTIRLQYRHVGDNDWHLIQEFTTHAEDTVGGQKVLIEGPAIYYSVAMTDTQFPDGEYEFRAVSTCTFGNDEITNESEIISVIKDMQRPMALGLPNPINGIYTSDNQVYVDLNEPIQAGRVRDKNISVTGVLNEQPIGDHRVALQLAERAYAFSDADFNYSGTDFTIEFWYNYTEGGPILCHALGTNLGMNIAVSDDRFGIYMGNFAALAKESLPKNQWCFVTIEYVADAYPDGWGELTAHYAYDDREVLLVDHVRAPKYDMRGNLVLGTSGIYKMHDVALWNIHRDWRTSLSERNKRKDTYTDGLLSYWPMDEGEGMVARDVIRGRDLQLSSSEMWWYNNNNIALTIPAGKVAKMDLSECPIPAGEDYVFECWFRMQEDGTLFYLSDSSLCVRFSGKKVQLTVSDGTWELPTATAVADGQWHHIALNYRHSTLPILIVDGKVLDVVGLREMPGFAAAHVVFSSEQSTSAVDIDEVRLWNAYLMPHNIALNRRNELKGDESGLVAYYPMEEDTQDEAMQPVKVFSLSDRVSKHTMSCEGGQAATVVAHLSKVRAVEEVRCTYTPSAQRIVINITESASRIEGCTLEFEVRDLVDEQGNYSLPIHWTAYVNRNQLLWNEEYIRLTKTALQDTTLTLTIVNNSGRVENWYVDHVPDWLALSETGGLLQPLQKKEISATIRGSLPIGNYEQTLYLIGNEMVRTPLRMSVRVNAERPDWHIHPADYEYSMNMIATATINTDVSDDSEDLVAAFIGGQLVGLTSPQLVSAYNRHYIMMNIYSNRLSSEVTFKYWDASTGRTYTDVGITLPHSTNKNADRLLFAGGQLVGTLAEPVKLKAGKTAEQQIALERGWNWISMNVQPDDVRLNAVMQDVVGDMTLIKSQDAFAQVNETVDTLQGSLKVMDCRKGYKLHVNIPVTKTVTGSVINPMQYGIVLRGGGSWNWIGYLPQMSLDVNTALANINPSEGDIIKSRADFATWDGYQWVGSLKVMSPGNGYLYCYVGNEEMTLYYPAGLEDASRARYSLEDASRARYSLEFRGGRFTPIEAGRYAGNMTMTAVVLDGEEIVTDAEVGIFAGEECRAVAMADDGLWFLTIPGDQSIPLSIRVAHKGEIITVEQPLTYVEDAAIGTCTEPYIIQIGERSGWQEMRQAGETRKELKNGILYIRRNGKRYSVVGASVEN
ncbi:MAG: LamG domain-containing protein [Paludibacteraceae bacterium]|nr:LamG domain-containing protein [Paludibacteraceae bacterium]